MKNEFEALANNAEWSEKAIEAYLVKRMESIGGKALKYTNSNRSGYPDRICIGPKGVIAFIEVKGKYGRLSQLQEKRIDELRQLGVMARVCSSKDDVDSMVDYLQTRYQYISKYDL